MNIIDAHMHFWQYDPIRYSWIDESMKTIQSDFLPQDIRPVFDKNNVSGVIAVEADQSDEETSRLLYYASKYTFIKGVVGYVDLFAENIDQQLIALSSKKKLKGFRITLQAKPPEYMLHPTFLNAIGKLQQFNFTYDLLILPQHLDAAIYLINRFPNQRFVIDHMAKPFIKDTIIHGWKQKIETLSTYQNVYCKISGIATEADWNQWTIGDLIPYLDIIMNSFGNDRVMYGSDWPVCLLATSYERWLQTLKNYFKQFTIGDQEKFFGKNAETFYNLDT